MIAPRPASSPTSHALPAGRLHDHACQPVMCRSVCMQGIVKPQPQVTALAIVWVLTALSAVSTKHCHHSWRHQPCRDVAVDSGVLLFYWIQGVFEQASLLRAKLSCSRACFVNLDWISPALEPLCLIASLGRMLMKHGASLLRVCSACQMLLSLMHRPAARHTA